jgi:hypothetical protein
MRIIPKQKARKNYLLENCKEKQGKTTYLKIAFLVETWGE